MCEPVTAATIGMSVLTTAFQFMGAKNLADAEADAAVDNFNATKDSANRDFLNKVVQENERAVQEAEADTEERIKADITSAETVARAKVSAGESGVSGISVDALLAEFKREDAVFENTLRRNAQFRESARRNRIESLEAQRESRINSAMPGAIMQPSLGAAALQIGGDSLDAYSDYRAEQRANKPRVEDQVSIRRPGGHHP